MGAISRFRDKVKAKIKLTQSTMFGIDPNPPAPEPSVVSVMFQGESVRIVMIDGEPRWVLADVARVLGYKLATNAGRLLRDKQKGIHKANTLGGEQEITVITEGGLYRLIMKSRSPVVDDFQDWVTDEVLPSIRKTGAYSLPGASLQFGTRPEARERNRNVNRPLPGRVIAEGGCVSDIADFHNAIYVGQLGLKAPELRDLVGLKPGKTPLDRMDAVLLSSNTHAKVLSVRKFEDDDVPLDQQPAVAEDIARSVQTDTMAVFPGHCVDVIEHAKGDFLGVTKAQLDKPSKVALKAESARQNAIGA